MKHLKVLSIDFNHKASPKHINNSIIKKISKGLIAICADLAIDNKSIKITVNKTDSKLLLLIDSKALKTSISSLLKTLMKSKRITLDETEKKQEKEIFNQRVLAVTKEGNEYFFEIGTETTTDVAEAVSILMRTVDWNDPIWKTMIDKKMIYENITPEKSLYWVSGRNKEWNSLDHYIRPWSDCYLEFQDEFGY